MPRTADVLRRRSYHRAEVAPPLLADLDRACRNRRCSEVDRAVLEILRGWVLTPLTLWPVQIDDLVRHAVAQLGSPNRRLDSTTRLLARLLGEARIKVDPTLEQHERDSQSGKYEGHFARHWRKFMVQERALLWNRQLRRDWEAIRATFDIDSIRGTQRVLRRSMLPERNFRAGWRLDLEDPRARFQAIFDTFCWRWNLYGMDAEDRPLLAKPTVSATPLGTLIFIPRYWDFDPSRDLAWPQIRRLHRTLDVGERKRALNAQVEMLQEAERAWQLNEEARERGLRGERLISWIMNQLGWPPGTDETKLRRRLKLYRDLADALP